jgi:5-methylcytosine-specific restriction endonuclease McrA
MPKKYKDDLSLQIFGLRECIKCSNIKNLNDFRMIKMTIKNRKTPYRLFRCKKCESEYGKLWRKKNPEKVRTNVLARRARKRNAEGQFTFNDFKKLSKDYCNKCLACNCKGTKENPLSMDHVIPLSRGGRNDAGNIQVLCKSCNSSKGLNIIDYRPFWLEWTLDILSKSNGEKVRDGRFKKGHISILPFKKGHIPWNKGKIGIYSEEYKRKISDAQLKSYYIRTPDGDALIIKGLRPFCRENNLNRSCMSQLANLYGKRKHYKGYWCFKPKDILPDM